MQGYFESGFPDITDLTSAFTKQYPSVTWNVREDPFATITQDAPLTLGGPNPPDLMRLPTIGGLVKDGLLKNLDPITRNTTGARSPLRSWHSFGRRRAASESVAARSSRWGSTTA